MIRKILCGLGAVALACAATASRADIHAEVYPVEAVILQVLKSFDNPEAVIFSADGKYLFVSNSAELGSERADGFGWGGGEGYISKLEVVPDGTLAMVAEKLIDGLTAPLGMGVLPKATESFPAGTIFVCVGSAYERDADGQFISDPALMRSKLVAFDIDGTVLGEIDTGSGSWFHQSNGSPIMLINALGFDADGNLFVVDSGLGGELFAPPFENKGGLWRIPHGALDDLAAGDPPAEPPSFLAIPGNPDGVEVSPLDGMVYVNTVGPAVGLPDPAGGGIYAIDGDDMSLGEPIDRDMGGLDGLDFTDGGVMLNTQVRADVPARLYVNCPGRRGQTLEIEPGGTAADMAGPADIAIRKNPDGTHLVAVPELNDGDPTPGDDEVTVLALPAGFEAACGR